MTDYEHSTLSGSELHPASWIQSTDPGPIGAGLQWIDTSDGTGNWVLKTRDPTNSFWVATPRGGTDPDMGYALCGVSTTQSITTSGNYFGFDNTVADPDSTITSGTGSTFKWTAPFDCIVFGFCTILKEGTNSFRFYWRVNGTNVRNVRIPNAGSWTGLSDSLVYPMSEDDYLQIYTLGYTTNNNCSNAWCWFNVYWMAT